MPHFVFDSHFFCLFGERGVDEAGPPDEGLSIDAIRELLELDFRAVVMDAALMYGACADDWERGVMAVWDRSFTEAVGLFMHSRPPGALRAVPSSRVAVGLVLLTCPRVGVPEIEVLRYFKARAAHPAAPDLRQWFPLAGGGALLTGHAARQAAVRAAHPDARRVTDTLLGRPDAWYACKRPVARAAQCPSATRLVAQALRLPNVVFVDCAANPNRQTGSRLHPFCDVPSALPHARAGDTIVLLPGHYAAMTLEHIQCTYDAPLHIRGVAAAAVVVGHRTPSSMAWTAAVLTLRQCTGVTLSHMTLAHTKTGVRLDDACSYVRLAELRVRACDVAFNIPDPHNHVVSVEDVARDGPSPGCARQAFDTFTRSRPLPQCLGPCWGVFFGLLVLGLSTVASLGILAYAESFYREDGTNDGVTAWVVSSITGILLDVFLQRPLLLMGMFGVLYMVGL